MQINSDKIKLLCGSGNFEEMPALKSLPPFSDTVCDFLNELSAALLKNAGAKAYPDVITFGFFCRKGNLAKLKADYEGRLAGRLGRGVAFHIAPSNVPVNFAYSLVSALLSGCSSVVRASAKLFPQVDIICGCICDILSRDSFATLRDYINVVRYDRDSGINDYFSAFADVRIIWGGDNTISEIRKSPLPPRATEITFADRYSAAVFEAAAILSADTGKLAADFYNDTYLFDQNACSAPRLVYWLGDENTVSAAQEKFWGAVHRLLVKKYRVEPVIAVDKYMAACRLAIEHSGKISHAEDNLISRIKLDKLPANIDNYRCAGGSFIEYSSENPDDLVGIINRKWQTISYCGNLREKLAELVTAKGLCGIDRIVPVGKTADFALVWDGYDLIMQMTRVIGF